MLDTNTDLRDMPLGTAQGLMFKMFEDSKYAPGGLPMTPTRLMLRIFTGREE